jgi:hypothetical protein
LRMVLSGALLTAPMLYSSQEAYGRARVCVLAHPSACIACAPQAMQFLHLALAEYHSQRPDVAAAPSRCEASHRLCSCWLPCAPSAPSTPITPCTFPAATTPPPTPCAPPLSSPPLPQNPQLPPPPHPLRRSSRIHRVPPSTPPTPRSTELSNAPTHSLLLAVASWCGVCACVGVCVGSLWVPPAVPLRTAWAPVRPSPPPSPPRRPGPVPAHRPRWLGTTRASPR